VTRLPSGENSPPLISHLSLVSHEIFWLAMANSPTFSYPFSAFEGKQQLLPVGREIIQAVDLLAIMLSQQRALAGCDRRHKDVRVRPLGLVLGVSDPLPILRTTTGATFILSLGVSVVRCCTFRITMSNTSISNTDEVFGLTMYAK